MNSLQEKELYLKAKADLLKAEDSFYKLSQEQRNKLIIELFGYESIVKLVETLRNEVK